MFQNFIKCGILGWCLEILFTSFHSFRKRDLTLTGKTSIWMFPIYGSACLLAPLSHLLQKKSLFFRGSIYTICIFTTEFFTGKLLWNHNLCPWNYYKSKWNIGNVIRLDYIPHWFLTGIFFEKIITKKVHS